MPSPVVDVQRIIASDWVATTPPDLTHIPYEYVEYRELDEDSTFADRAFVFLPVQPGGVESETDDSALVRYQLQAVLVLSDNGRTETEFQAAIANEGSLLRRVVERRSDWTDGGAVSGIWEVITTRPPEVERDEESGAAILTFTFECLVGES